ncbi:hypothetical protein DFQ28_000142 [Apophysomyces sp. BC1034]|nr:hypothetical protein DFQ30_000311 [Apophysomyces sp. BC1015]KAG0168352.1 hypothetical protein DFQ29_010185 [Apophysomyces sp. BC1021]KAG0184099.1 hypothetical protein DFQ28_000142 [Apophysomyces sp. BC1034]
MFTLPLEVLELIRGKLPEKEQFNFLFVCRQWYLVFRATLYHDIVIRSHEQLELLLRNALAPSTTTQSPLGHQVKRLTFEHGEITRNMIEQLALLCPFVESLAFSFEVWVLLRFPRVFLLWPHLKSLSQPGCEELMELSLSRTESHLEHLTVQFARTTIDDSLHGVVPSYFDIDMFGDFLYGIRGPSLLTSLTLFGNNQLLYVSDMKVIHEKCPLLESIQLSQFMLAKEDPQDVECTDYPAATHLKALEIRNSLRYPLEWLFYIADKYRNLQKLILHSYLEHSIYWEEGHTTQSFQTTVEAVNRIAENCRQLESVELIGLPVDHRFYATLQCSSKVSKLGLVTLSDVSDIKDSAQPNFQRSVSSLSVWRFGKTLQRVADIGYFQSLVDLTLYNYSSDLTLVLNCCKHITKLALAKGRLDLENENDISVHHRLTKLALYEVKIGDVALIHIASQCTRLEDLTVWNCEMTRQHRLVTSQSADVLIVNLGNRMMNSIHIQSSLNARHGGQDPEFVRVMQWSDMQKTCRDFYFGDVYLRNHPAEIEERCLNTDVVARFCQELNNDPIINSALSQHGRIIIESGFVKCLTVNFKRIL